VTYKPTPDLSLYYVHSEEADPPTTTAEYSNFSPSGGATAPPPTDPIYNLTITSQTKAKYDEFGAKTQLFDKAITASVAFFQSYRSGFILNQTLTEPGYNGVGSVLYNQNYIVNGEIVQGMEAELFGRPTSRLTLTAGCAFENGQKPGPASTPTVAGQVGNSQSEPVESLINSLMFYGKYDFRDSQHNGFEVTAGGKFFFKDWVVSPGTTVTFNSNQYLIDLGASYYFHNGRYFVSASVNNVTNQLVYISQNSQWSLRRSFVSFGTRF
jgi:outer membrane receptor for ferric coprogen and ferric-rhodotorulic acid